jgi:hypothetical protein
MMTVKAKVLAFTLLLGIVALPALANRGPGGSGHPGVGQDSLTDGRFLTRYLHLSSTQVTQLNGFLGTLHTAVQAVQAAQPALCQTLRTDAGASSPDPTTVGKDFLALVDNQDKVQTALAAFDTSFSAILNSEQLARYDALKQAIGLGNGGHTDILPVCPPASSST